MNRFLLLKSGLEPRMLMALSDSVIGQMSVIRMLTREIEDFGIFYRVYSAILKAGQS